MCIRDRFITADINSNIATRENLCGDQKKYPKAKNRNKKMGYPVKEML